MNLIMQFPEQIKQELIDLKNYKDVNKDILIVVKDQFNYFKACVESIVANTKNYNLYVWDNGSNQEVQDYIKSIDCISIRSEENIGFIRPNNELAKLTKSDYIILLNSDTIVMPTWDHALINLLKIKELGAAGYSGGILDETTMGGCQAAYGYNADYIEGWCLALPRSSYEKIGLFDEEHLDFAYCEDSDFCLRLKENELKTYVSYLGLVHHVGHVTVKSVGINNCKSFDKNHEYMKKRWRDKLPKLRSFNIF